MKKVIWFLIILIVIFLIFGYLYHKGYIHTSWQWLAAILAGAAGPFEFLRQMFTGETITEKKIIEIQEKRKKRVKQHRVQYDQIIKQKESRIRELEAQVDRLQDKVDSLELQLQSVDKETENLTVPEIQEEFIKYYGEE